MRTDAMYRMFGASGGRDKPFESTSTEMRTSAIFVCALGALVSACSSSCERHKPYVPFESQDATPALIDAAVIPMADGSAVSLANATEWESAGGKIVAPPDHGFVQALSGDFDGDGSVDAIAVAKRMTDMGPGAIWFYRGAPGGMREPSLTLAAPELTTDPTCSPKPLLERSGAHSVYAELGLECAGHDSVGAKRLLALLVVDARGVRVHGTFTFQPPPYLNLSVAGDGSDQDGDGVDDVSLVFSLPGPQGVLKTRLSWFDRATGLSRNVEEPENSLREIVKRIGPSVDSPKEARTVHGTVDAMHQLARVMCADAGGPSVSSTNLELPKCATSRALRDAAFLDVKGFVTLKDPARALQAFDVAVASKELPSASAVRDTERAILKLAPAAVATRVTTIEGVTPPPRAKTAEWGSLSFMTPTTFLVRGQTDSSEVDAATGKVIGTSTQTWGPRVVSPDGSSRFVEVYNPCDGGPFHATFAPERDGDPRDVLLPLRTSLQPCKRGEGERARVVPLSWTTKGFALLVNGVPVRVADGEGGLVTPVDLFDAGDAPRGSPRSPDGKVSAVTSSLGVLVGTGKKKRLFRFPEIPPLSLIDCVPNEQASLLACVRGERVIVGEWASVP